MKTLALAATVSLLSLVAVDAAIAQVSSDGTLSTTVNNGGGNNFVIEGGDRAGNNLFHSFRDFSVPTSGSATFNNAADVQNIFSRITGGNVSNIDGLIRANGKANLFLLNPNGIIFGPNASLNIGGSFVGTTANSLRFADGIEFMTTSTGTPLLTISAPVGLQMGQTPGAITVQGSGHRTTVTSFLPFDRSNNPIGLQVGAGNTLALIGGQVDFSGGIAAVAGGGHVEVGSVSQGQVRLNPTTQGWVGDYSAVQQFNDIHLAQHSLLDASGNDGSIQLQGRNIRLSEASLALVQRYGGSSAEGINVSAAGTLTLAGNTSDGKLGSAIGTQNFAMGSGNNVTVSARQIAIQDGGRIATQTFTGAPGGNVHINAADSIQSDGFMPRSPASISTIATGSYDAGNAGNVAISTNQLRLLNGSSVVSVALSTGRAGDIRVDADQINLIGTNPIILSSSTIASTTFRAGNAGNVLIDTSRLSLQGGGVIAAGTFAQGSSGDVTINASEAVSMDGRGAGSLTYSSIDSSAVIREPEFRAALGLPPSPTGDSGSVTINTPSLHITNGARVTVQNDGPGSAGNLRINANRIDLSNQGSITASTVSSNGGNINLQVDNLLRLQSNSNISASAAGQGNGGRITVAARRLDLEQSQIGTQAVGSGNAGNLQIRVDELNLNRGQIAVASQGSGNAGQLTVNANSAQLNHHSVINASTQVGRGGDVQLQVRDRLQLNDQSQILANAQQSGRGGNVRILAADIVLQNRSRISTNAQGTAVGGALTIGGDRLSLLNGSQITSSTAGSGRAGSLNIQANDITLSGRNTRLAAASSTDAPAGSIHLRSPHVTVSDRAAISVSGQGQGGAGNLTIQANQINLEDQATLEAEVAGGDRGNITLDANLLSLRGRSQITTNATGTASGGNINLNTDFVIGLENSDIVARAQQGSGGNIAIDTQGLLGIEPRAELTSNSDINASSQLGLNGTVNLTNPDITPESGLVELPAEVTDSSQQIAQTCASTQTSRFVVTGRGGIPQDPHQTLESDRLWSDIRELSTFGHPQATQLPDTSAEVTSSQVEASTWVHNTKGEIELIAVNSVNPVTNPTVTCAGQTQ
jgi:filamentous hemagglutinin family protein